jgi:hypothetical protein
LSSFGFCISISADPATYKTNYSGYNNFSKVHCPEKPETALFAVELESEKYFPELKREAPEFVQFVPELFFQLVFLL